MKILRVTSDIYPGMVGGLYIHAHDLSNFQGKLGHIVTVYTSANPNLSKYRLELGYKLFQFKNNLDPLGNHFSIGLLLQLFKNRKTFDIIHAHSHLFFYTNCCALIRKFGSSPLVITNHGIFSASAPDWFNSIYMLTLGKWTLRAADRIICYTQIEKDKLVKNYGISSNKISVIPNGINIDLFSPKINSDNKYKTILWVGRFVKGKGIKYLLKSTEILSEEFPDLRVRLIGEGPERQAIECSIKKLHLENIVSIEKFRSYEEMADVYNSINILVLPSLNEGVPKTMLEAMSCGKPIVITEFDHLSDIINGCGLTFPKGDWTTLAEICKKLLKDDELAQNLGKHGRECILTSHSWDRTVAKTLELYEALLNSK